jgi:hypothetical protein
VSSATIIIPLGLKCWQILFDVEFGFYIDLEFRDRRKNMDCCYGILGLFVLAMLGFGIYSLITGRATLMGKGIFSTRGVRIVNLIMLAPLLLACLVLAITSGTALFSKNTGNDPVLNTRVTLGIGGGIFIGLVAGIIATSVIRRGGGKVIPDELMFKKSKFRCKSCGHIQEEGDWEDAMNRQAKAMGSKGFVNISAEPQCLNCGVTQLEVISKGHGGWHQL